MPSPLTRGRGVCAPRSTSWRSDPPQVLILEGGSVAERFSVALWHAARLNCPEGRPPCLHCPACLQIGANLFHDLYVLDGREGSIKIETVRELRTILGEAPRGDGKRVVILAEAQSLGVEAANALLKSLEEPRPGVCFLLLAPQRGASLPTLVSRGWVVRWRGGAGTPSTPELFQWEEALAEFGPPGRGGSTRRPARVPSMALAAGSCSPSRRHRPLSTPGGMEASWTASCILPEAGHPCQRSAGAMPGIAGLWSAPRWSSTGWPRGCTSFIVTPGCAGGSQPPDPT
ncbi:MAG: DNA polymerase III subunit delta [Bilophila wadsworthia]